MDLDLNQTTELDHLVRLARTHPNWAEYACWKAQARAAKYPLEWGWLPLALINALQDKAISTNTTAVDG